MSRDWQKDMTREEILALEPGRDLNALVATNVMSWTLLETHETVYDMEGRIEGGSLWRDDEGFAAWLPDYSTDISAAWEVVEKLKDKVNISVYTDDNGKYAAEINFYVLDDFDTAPEAICKAALLAVLEEEEA